MGGLCERFEGARPDKRELWLREVWMVGSERVESVNRRRVEMVGWKMVETVRWRRAEPVSRPRVQVARPRGVKAVRRWGVEGAGCFWEGGSHEGGTRLAAGKAVQCAVAAVFLA